MVSVDDRAEADHALYRRTVHDPHHDTAAGLPAPDDVLPAVAVVVADAFDLVVGVDAADVNRGLHSCAGGVHDPNLHVSIARIAPHDVGTAVAVEIADAFDVRRCADRAEAVDRHDGRAVHEPLQRNAVDVAAPHDVGLAVGVEVAAVDAA